MEPLHNCYGAGKVKEIIYFSVMKEYLHQPFCENQSFLLFSK